MFHVIEQIKGTPTVVKGGLLFGKDDVYNYFIVGCPTLVTQDSYDNHRVTNWNSYQQKYSVEDFIKQVQKISKRDKFEWLVRGF